MSFLFNPCSPCCGDKPCCSNRRPGNTLCLRLSYRDKITLQWMFSAQCLLTYSDTTKHWEGDNLCFCGPYATGSSVFEVRPMLCWRNISLDCSLLTTNNIWHLTGLLLIEGNNIGSFSYVFHDFKCSPLFRAYVEFDTPSSGISGTTRCKLEIDEVINCPNPTDNMYTYYNVCGLEKIPARWQMVKTSFDDSLIVGRLTVGHDEIVEGPNTSPHINFVYWPEHIFYYRGNCLWTNKRSLYGHIATVNFCGNTKLFFDEGYLKYRFDNYYYYNSSTLVPVWFEFRLPINEINYFGDNKLRFFGSNITIWSLINLYSGPWRKITTDDWINFKAVCQTNFNICTYLPDIIYATFESSCSIFDGVTIPLAFGHNTYSSGGNVWGFKGSLPDYRFWIIVEFSNIGEDCSIVIVLIACDGVQAFSSCMPGWANRMSYQANGYQNFTCNPFTMVMNPGVLGPGAFLDCIETVNSVCGTTNIPITVHLSE